MKSVQDIQDRAKNGQLFAFKSNSSKKYLNGAKGKRAQVTWGSPWDRVALQWKLIITKNGYKLRNEASGMYLDGRGFGERTVYMADKTDAKYLQWRFKKHGQAPYHFLQLIYSRRYLDGRSSDNWIAYMKKTPNPAGNGYVHWLVEPIYDKKLVESYTEQLHHLNYLYDDSKKECLDHERQLNELNTQIANEKQLIITDFDEEHKDENSKIVILIGNTGDGKSTFGNRLLNDESESADEGQLTVGHGADSCTQRLSNPERTQINGVSIAVIDAPGWSDTNMDDRMHENNLCAYLRGCGGINRFVLVRNASNCRFDANLQNILRRYADMFGDAFWSHLIVILTHVDSGIPERQYARGQKAETLIKRICTQFRLDRNRIDIPVFPVGLDKYKQTIHQFVECLRNSDKFECDAIKSPLDHLQDQVHQKNNERDEIERALDTIRASQESIQKEINILKYL
eukprot:27288_1